jgi:hypothetical protein
MSAASCLETLDSGKAGMIGASVVLNFFTKLPKAMSIPAILAARPSLPWGPWHEEQLFIIYHLFPSAGFPGGAPQPLKKIRQRKKSPMVKIWGRGRDDIRFSCADFSRFLSGDKLQLVAAGHR